MAELDPKGLEASVRKVGNANPYLSKEVAMVFNKEIIRAYLDAAPSPSPAPGVVTLLERFVRVFKTGYSKDAFARRDYDDIAAEAMAALASLSPQEPSPAKGVDTLRHECARSGMHEHDGCSCTDEELLRRAFPAKGEREGEQP